MQEVKNVNVTVTKLNLLKFANSASIKNATENERNVKESIYIYPENVNKNNEGQCKAFRQSMRTKRNNFCNYIFTAYKTVNVELLLNKIAEFNIFYKATYLKNDFSVSSISNKVNCPFNADLKIMFDIIADIKLQTTKVKKVTAKKVTAKKVTAKKETVLTTEIKNS
jgi:hypothetical protein